MKRKLNIRQIIFAVLSVLCMTVIFIFSADNAEDSSEKSGRIVKAVVKIFVSDFDEMDNEKQEEILGNVSFFVRKAAHFSIFMALGFCVSGIFGKIKFLSRNTPITLLFCFLYACSDEFHQSFSPGRAPQVRDVLIDTSGALTGTIAFSLIYAIIIHRKRRKSIST